MSPSAAQHLPDNGTDSGSHWLDGFSSEQTMSIGRVVDELKAEFPAIKVSKLRYLEDDGLISPSRTASGYRKFSPADVERLRYILREQRDYMTRNAVIRQQLEALDAGHVPERSRPARLVAAEGEIVTPPGGRDVSTRELLELTGIAEDELEEMVRVGLLTPDIAGYFPSRSVQIAVLVRSLGERGLEPRNLRSVRSAAERCVDVIDTAVASRRARSRPGDLERAIADSNDFGEVFGELVQELIRCNLDRLNEDRA